MVPDAAPPRISEGVQVNFLKAADGKRSQASPLQAMSISETQCALECSRMACCLSFDYAPVEAKCRLQAIDATDDVLIPDKARRVWQKKT